MLSRGVSDLEDCERRLPSIQAASPEVDLRNIQGLKWRGAHHLSNGGEEEGVKNYDQVSGTGN